ncbi:phospholipase D-like domain-containing protein [Janibacter alkaliphilus]|uniref:Cardiolipin synthase n=1 Tax=Janibacter alkaliphilus TaxID=1069963 RepID=A0A852X420_9MICO|nr:phosphatidylserine/phosphatidylglycerophosphate/cardiolipin synthase family protein [Janibacter alkaliphilus]NYG37178.1 cardiolipin synthase [Janibacter alkaliphilus]
MSARRTLHRFFERRERQRRRQRMRRLVRRGVMGTLAVQTATAAGLFTFDSIRKKDRPEGAFPHRPAETVALPRSEVRVFMYGEELFEQMLEDIEAAQHRVFLETYIWKGDEMGQRFRDALVRADARGVEVYVVIDDFANLVVPASFKRSLPATVHAAAHPLVSGGWKFLHPRYSGRDHRKLLVVDSDIAYVGGFNIGSLYATKWRDTHARITGEFVVELENAFIDYWNVHARRGDEAPLPEPTGRAWSQTLRVHRNTPVDLVYPIRNMYLEAIDRAERSIAITQAYLIPDEAFRRALVRAAQRGADVRIIVPRFSNHVFADWFSRTHFTELLKGGVRILRYEHAMVHAKTATIDGRWSTIGTANIDRLSLVGNYEVNVEIIDEALAAQMEAIFELDATNCTELTLEEWTARPMIARATEGILAPWRDLA